MLPGPVVRHLLALVLLVSAARAHDAADEMAGAANDFLAALEPGQRQQAQHEFQDDERFNWHYVPRARKGLPFKEMTPEQRAFAHALLKSGLSSRGHEKVRDIIILEEVLAETESPLARGRRDSELYFITIFGTPDPAGAWGWRLEGHHIAFNITVVDGREAAGSPSFLGANPAEVRDGPHKGLRALAGEEDLARDLVKSMTPAQLGKAVFADQAPREIITRNQRKVALLETVGIGHGELTEEQQAMLMALIEEYARRLRAGFAQRDLEKITAAGLGEIRFGWAGGMDKGQGHYYRVQGPTFLIEYDNTQNDANHIHAVWRDFENDFGEDLLRRHYEENLH